MSNSQPQVDRRPDEPGHDDPDASGLPERMAEAARDLQVQQDPAATYAAATRLAHDNILGCHAASLSMVRRSGSDRIVNFAATHPGASRADELQTEHSEGPCLDSIVEAVTTYSPSLAHDHRWPRWGPEVVEQTGLRSVLSFQLFTHLDTLGALNLYSLDKDGFGAEDQHDGQVLAAHVAIAFAAAQRIDALDHALSTRTVIGQATGILMERYQVSSEVAFRILGRISSQEERKIRDLAREVVSTGRLPGLDHADRS
ncbi:GAF and ANTAR domain-containing protein [Nocardioides sp. CFH 31398]|uniref:GAF and ANTAR domain-containing protein n=1 Tax=Nocardioides sp. CFH 31398 TaxID=2919579 RepID=UPI001F06AA74|nr:GAF and ANTAR domain-containing protein [Nocardioides sp. CFH 31398]MCH1867002.1 GAF and ANTAR domain-containing protein [Nocardioides sp. CFH 31398]